MRKRIKRTVLVTTKFSLYWIGFFMLATGFWISRKFGEPSFEQVLYHLQFGSEGLLDTDTGLLKSFIRYCIIFPTIPAGLVYFYERFITSLSITGSDVTLNSSKKLLTGLRQKSWVSIYKLSLFTFKAKLPLTLLVISAIFLLSKVTFWSYLLNSNESKFIEDNYIAPVSITHKGKKKNLVLIYVESLENTYSNKKIFGEDLLDSINKKTVNAITFKNYRQTSGTGWTMAGIVSTQCGIPLKSIFLIDENRQGEKVKTYLGKAVCLGDILNEYGYRNIFMGGASLSFAGKGKFFEEHAYSERYGVEEWKALGEKTFNGWGLYDDTLFSKAKIKVSELEKNNKPYNLNILTVDTHHPEGHISQTCKQKGVTEFTGIVKCTSDMLADFIHYMSMNGYLENTNIVIFGDHLAMVNSVYPKLLKEENRTVYNKFIISNTPSKNREDIHSFSMFPTILYSLGFRFKDNRLGLGTSGFGELNNSFQLDTMSEKDLESSLSRPSKKYLELW